MKPKGSSSSRQPILTLANQISVFRIIMIPVIVILLIERRISWAELLFGFSLITDLLDGLVARLKKENTEIGAFLDPMADKLLLTFVYLTLAYLGVIDMWVFVVVFSRDLIIVLGWAIIFILTGSSKIQPRILGKLTTAVQMMAGMEFIHPISPSLSHVCLWAIVLSTLASVIDYLIIGEKRLGQLV